MYYQTKIKITNHDGDISSWTISFDVQDGILADKTAIWVASETTFSGNTVTMKCQGWNANILDGGELNIEFQLLFASKEPLNITNLKINGKKATLEM